MKKISSLIVLLVFFQILGADAYVDSLKKIIDSLPYSYEKGDKIWDLAIYQQNTLSQSALAIENFKKVTQMFTEMDSLEIAVKVNRNIINVAYMFPEYFYESKNAFAKHIEFLNNPRLKDLKRGILIDIQRHVTNAYYLKEMEDLEEALELTEEHFSDKKNDDLKIHFDHFLVLLTNFLYGEEKALEKSIEIYHAIENDEYKVSFEVKELARVQFLSTMQNYHYYRGNIEQSNKLLDEAIVIATNLHQNNYESLSELQKINLISSISQIMSLKIDNLEITEDNLEAIENGYLDVNKIIKPYNFDKVINNYSKIAHAYDIIYSGNHRKIKYYLDMAEEGLDRVNQTLYITNFYLTKARFLLNKKKYAEADVAFTKVEEFIDSSNQSWIYFNYIMERSRYFFETNQTKKAYDMITKFYKSIDKEFSDDIAEKTAELNNQLDTQKLVHQQALLEDELRIKSLQSSRETLVTTLVGLVLGFTTLLLINNVRANKKLKKHLHSQGSKLKEEMDLSNQRAQELIFSEKLSTSGQIASSIAHEIKNPLTNIITAAKLLNEANNKEEISKYYSICERNSWLAIDKINALLEYSKQKQMNFIDYSLKTVIKEAYDLSKGSLDNNNVQMNLIYKTHDDICQIDPKEISGVLVNLIMNSIQAMDKDNRNKTIDIILSNDDNYFIIKVNDNGFGIEKDRLNNIFNPFYTTKTTGTGLGLSYAQKVLVEHHGTIEVESELDKGTSMIIRLPREFANDIED